MTWLAVTLGVFLFFIGLCILSALPMVRRQPIKEIHSPAEFQLAFNEISFPAQDGILLKGWWMPCMDSDRTIITLHGYAGSMDPDIRYAPHLHNAGFNVLMFDFRAHGRSGGRLTSLGALETRDVQAAVRFALDKGSRRIGLLGFSMGGRAVILAAPSIPQVNALISDGGPARMLTSITQNLSLRNIPFPLSWILARMVLTGASIITGVNLFKADPLNTAGKLDRIPTLFIHGEKDRYTTAEEIKTMVSLAGPNARLWSVPEARHRNIEETRSEEYLQVVISFFSENL